MKTLVWRDHSGEMIEEVVAYASGVEEFALSPDRRWVASTVDEPASIWIPRPDSSYDDAAHFCDGGARGENRPSWAPSGEEISYVTTESPTRLMRRRVDGSGEPSLLVESEFATANADWSRDGRYVVFNAASGTGTRNDILYVELEARSGPFQPPGSCEHVGRREQSRSFFAGRALRGLCLKRIGAKRGLRASFPSGDGRWQVSLNGGEQPRWRNDGKELFYVENDTMMMAVPASTGQELTFGRPQRL